MRDIYQISRDRMVREQLARRGIKDENVLRAMASVPRHVFLEEGLWPRAYEDCPLPIACGQTISQPYIVALMSEMLETRPGMRVLEVGTGSGYQAAVLNAMGLDVHSVEYHKELYSRVSKLFWDLRYDIRLKQGDGTRGWAEAAPFDRIIVTAGGPKIPDPLLEQLADPGILVIPVGAEKRSQVLARAYKAEGRIRIEHKERVAFVDLKGDHGW